MVKEIKDRLYGDRSRLSGFRVLMTGIAEKRSRAGEVIENNFPKSVGLKFLETFSNVKMVIKSPGE